MARVTTTADIRPVLVELRGVRKEFPLHGAVHLASGGSYSYSMLADQGAVVSPSLLSRLGVTIGDRSRSASSPRQRFWYEGTRTIEPGRSRSRPHVAGHDPGSRDRTAGNHALRVARTPGSQAGQTGTAVPARDGAEAFRLAASRRPRAVDRRRHRRRDVAGRLVSSIPMLHRRRCRHSRRAQSRAACSWLAWRESAGFAG